MGSSRTPSARSDLRLSDLTRVARAADDKLMNVKVPDAVADRIAAIATQLESTKQRVIVALLNEGLAAFESRRDEFQAVAQRRAPRRRPSRKRG